MAMLQPGVASITSITKGNNQKIYLTLWCNLHTVKKYTVPNTYRDWRSFQWCLAPHSSACVRLSVVSVHHLLKGYFLLSQEQSLYHGMVAVYLNSLDLDGWW